LEFHKHKRKQAFLPAMEATPPTQVTVITREPMAAKGHTSHSNLAELDYKAVWAVH